MALDRQKILNELGSVMNQLKNTDCGCMSKLFGDSGQSVTQTGNGSTCGGYTQSCGHGHHHGCSSSMPNNIQNFHRPCIGQCNPPKLFADTYNYLNENLMQPTINEVYNDLKNITPANTIMNNPMAQKIGLSNQNHSVQPTIDSLPHIQMKKQNILNNMNAGNMAATSGLNSNNNMRQIGGMGPQIMNMFEENQISKPNNTLQQAKPVILPTSNQQNYNEHTAFAGQPQNTNHLIHQPNQPIGNCQPPANVNTNVELVQQTPPNNHHHHGQHAQGMDKFKKMFPTVMNNDLGFDPMEIAIQMNPANQKKVAIDTIHKMMNNNNNNSMAERNNNNPAVHSAFNESIISNQYNVQPNQIQSNTFPNEVLESNVLNQQANQQMLLQQPATNTAQINNEPVISNQQVSQPSTNPYGSYTGQAKLNTYSAVSSSPLLNQQQQPAYYQQAIESNSTAIGQSNLPTVYEASGPNKLQKVPEIPNTQQIIKEPILPADTSKFVMPKQKYYEYNTLGQPIQMLPADIYHTPVPRLPQTLSPQVPTNPRNNFTKYSTVKSTISKTSLMGNKPIDKTPSRSQLQHIYNQYKGSQSFTHQNIKEQFNKDISHSDGRLNVPHVNLTAQQVPIENVGGDTTANNQLNNERVNKMGHMTEQIGDAPIIKQTNNLSEKLSPAVNRKGRNGLQDMVFTSYPTSAAWSFHGHGRAAPYSAGYRYRNKI
ncbi:unnamed protein product [Euphydryas editha]|uniref:Uncharacterized protein n=1 Tax=Euphydryas editha TaxID=104508 RepID=A0AAU9U391_EUPED|nr:unnamed protein product [Euphydryas editha]